MLPKLFMPKLTKTIIENYTVSKDTTIWDTQVRGFGIRITPTGNKTFLIYWRRDNGAQRKKSIGKYGKITIEQARKIAQSFFYKISMGEEPLQKRNDLSFREYSSMYLDEYSYHHKSPATFMNETYIINNHLLPKFGKKKINDLTRREIEKFLNSFQSHKVLPNRILSLISHMYTKSIEWGYSKLNPTQGIKKKKEEKRSRYLTRNEINRLLEVLNNFTHKNVSQALKLLLFTGSRKGEVLGAKWSEFDFENTEWVKPMHRTKQRKQERIPLNEEALKVLYELKETRTSIFLFPSPSKKGHLLDIKSSWEHIRREAKLADVRIHDLRHTYASILINNGVSLSIVGKLLGHSNASTTERYAHLNNDTLRRATNIIKLNQL